MPESASHASEFVHSKNVQSPSKVLDRELNGELNRASAQGAKFGLLLAMLEQDYLHRPKLLAGDSEHENSNGTSISGICHYPPTPLKAEAQHWQQADFTSDIINKESIVSAHLWLVMHPQPLSLFNNAYKIEGNVLENCDFHTQQRHKVTLDKGLPVDETGLYDILQGMNEGVDTAA